MVVIHFVLTHFVGLNLKVICSDWLYLKLNGSALLVNGIRKEVLAKEENVFG